MRLDYINSWKKGNKQSWKGDISIRFGRITLFELEWDFRGQYIRFMLLNFGFELMY
tara:strand:+ start:1050 stop:1217 length:168 start_codon:yes stop_codon:yes gene_type:complete